MFPTEAFSTMTQRKILRVLAQKNKRYTITELAKMCHRSEASISRALQKANRYPFIEKDRVPGSKQLTFRLEPESQYTASIRDFFNIEHDRERQNGIIPVEVWNLLEDLTHRFEDQIDGFVELFLFGSYATGEYYAGSDIDLLLMSISNSKKKTDQIIQKTGDNRIQVIQVHIDESRLNKMNNEEILETVRRQSPASGSDVLVPLSGVVKI